MTTLINAPGLFFFALVAGPGLVLILNHLSLKAQSGRVSPARLDWGDEVSAVEFFWPRLSGRGVSEPEPVHGGTAGEALSVSCPVPRAPATERPLARTLKVASCASMSGVERKPPRSVAGTP